MIKQFLKDSLVYAVASLLSRGLSFLLVPYYSRALTKNEFGNFDLATSVVMITTVLVAAEISQGMARSYGDHKNSDDRDSLFLSSLLFLVVSYTLFAIGLFAYREAVSNLIFGDHAKQSLLMIAVLCSFVTALQIQINNHFRWSLQTKKAAVYSVVQTLGTLLFTILFVSQLGLGAWGAILGVTTSLALLVAYELIDLHGVFRAKFSWRRTIEMLRFSFPLIPSGIALFTTQFANRFVVRDLMSTDSVAELAVAARISAIVGLVMMGIGSALMPLVSEHADDPQTPYKIAVIFNKIVALALVAVTALACLSRYWVVLFSTGDYFNAAPLLGLLSAATIMSQLYPFAPGFWLKKKVWTMVSINVSAAILVVVLNYALVPIYGLMGVAFSTFISALLMIGSSIFFSNRMYPIPYTTGRVGIAMVCAFLIVFAHHKFGHYFAGEFAYAISAIVALLLSVLVVMTTGLLPLAELQAGGRKIIGSLVSWQNKK